MPLPPALAAKLAKRGLIQTKTATTNTSSVNRNKENSSSSDQPKFVEEVIAESYDDPKKGTNPSSVSSSSGVLQLGQNRNKSTTVITKFHRMGHYGCPNKSNIHHICCQFCVTRWGRGKSTPRPEYNRRRLKMLKKYPLPSSWIEVYDPGTGRYYYWQTDTDNVCWTSPGYPKAVIGRSAPDLREKLLEKEQATASMPPPSTTGGRSFIDRKSSRKRRSAKEQEELDPMDPASYSDIPRGTWSTGLLAETVTGVDTTASGPLFQQRPYPSPGDILRSNTGKKK